MADPISPPAFRRVRILALWGAKQLDHYFIPSYMNNPRYEVELVSGDRHLYSSFYAIGWRRLWKLRRKLERGEFDLIISGPVENSMWPRHKPLFPRLENTLRFLTYKHKRIDTEWAPWLIVGSVRKKVPLAVIDFTDPSFVQPNDFCLLEAATLYFKINLYNWPRRSIAPLEAFLGSKKVLPHLSKLRRLTYGLSRGRIPETVRPMRERDIDIFFSGSIPPNSDTGEGLIIRRDIYQRCLRLGDRYKVICINGLLPKKEYEDLLQRSKMVVCTESFGCDTGRHFDVAAHGSVILSNWIYTQGNRPFLPDIHAIYFSLMGDDFERVTTSALADPEKLARIAQNARAFTCNELKYEFLADEVVNETLRQHVANMSAEKKMEALTYSGKKLP